MRWLLYAVIGCAAAAAMRGDAAEPAPIYKTPTPIAIDGVLDEPAWKQAEVIGADYIWGQVGKRSARPQLRVRYT